MTDPTIDANKREERILVLYASQRGSAEEAAIHFQKEISKRLCPTAIAKLLLPNEDEPTSTEEGLAHDVVSAVPATETPLELDEFLENGSPWTRIAVIFTSSFGRGGAPLSGRKFRKRCDAWIDSADDENDENTTTATSKPLQGLVFALCGLGDSSYENTFMENPKQIAKGLTTAGAEMVGERGSCDCERKNGGLIAQQKAIQEWMDAIWLPLARAVANGESLSPEQLQVMKEATGPV